MYLHFFYEFQNKLTILFYNEKNIFKYFGVLFTKQNKILKDERERRDIKEKNIEHFLKNNFFIGKSISIILSYWREKKLLDYS